MRHFSQRQIATSPQLGQLKCTADSPGRIILEHQVQAGIRTVLVSLTECALFPLGRRRGLFIHCLVEFDHFATDIFISMIHGNQKRRKSVASVGARGWGRLGLEIDAVCDLESFRRFMIVSTCESFIPEDLDQDEQVFPERATEQGTMYVEAEDKETVQMVRDIRFMRVSNVLGIIYKSKSGRTHLKWRHLKGNMGRLTGEASTNTLVNLFTSHALNESYARQVADDRQVSEEEQSA